MTKSIHGIRRVINAATYSFKGIAQCFKREPAFKEEMILAAFMLPFALWVDVGVVEKIILVATVLLVLITELLNSAVEAVVDLVSPDHHELAGLAKDFGSAAVFFALILCAFSWAMILIEHFFK